MCEWTKSTWGMAATMERSAAEHPESGVGAFRIVLRVRGRPFARLAHALNIDIDQLAQLRHQLGDVHTGAAVDRGGILPGQQRDGQSISVCQRHSSHRSTAAALKDVDSSRSRTGIAAVLAPRHGLGSTHARSSKVLAIVLGRRRGQAAYAADNATGPSPACPFGGTYRLIDFVLSNLANAGMRQIAV